MPLGKAGLLLLPAGRVRVCPWRPQSGAPGGQGSTRLQLQNTNPPPSTPPRPPFPSSVHLASCLQLSRLPGPEGRGSQPGQQPPRAGEAAGSGAPGRGWVSPSPPALHTYLQKAQDCCSIDNSTPHDPPTKGPAGGNATRGDQPVGLLTLQGGGGRAHREAELHRDTKQ